MLDNILKCDIVILIEELNAEGGSDNSKGHVMSIHDTGVEMIMIGKLLSDFCKTNDSNSFPVRVDRICVRYLRLKITSRIMRSKPIHNHLTSGARECFQTSHIGP